MVGTRSSAAGVDFSLFGGAEVLPPSMEHTNSQATTDADSGSSSGDEAVLGEEYKLAGEAWAPKVINPPQDGSDYLWLMTEEPHRTRRNAILKDHPEVKKLMGYDPLTKYLVALVQILHITTAYLMRDTEFWSLKFFFVAWLVGGSCSQNTFLAVHEITHNLAFKGVKQNRLFAILTNCSIGVPFAMMFKKYHIDHHKYLGEDGIDTDIPSRLELLVLKTVLGKAFFATFQIFFYALRPGFIKYQAPTRWIALNFAVQLTFNYLVVTHWGWYSMLYLLLSSHMAGSLHFLAGHFIAEHYLFDGHDQETWSYYGPLNWLTWNVGYHNEHHDFPSVSWRQLPKLRKIASEYYDCLPQHSSWPMVTVRFIFDPSVGMWSRVKRSPRGRAKGGDEGGDPKDWRAGGLKDD